VLSIIIDFSAFLEGKKPNLRFFYNCLTVRPGAFEKPKYHVHDKTVEICGALMWYVHF